eukprot:gene15448-biopygen4280
MLPTRRTGSELSPELSLCLILVRGPRNRSWQLSTLNFVVISWRVFATGIELRFQLDSGREHPLDMSSSETGHWYGGIDEGYLFTAQRFGPQHSPIFDVRRWKLIERHRSTFGTPLA